MKRIFIGLTLSAFALALASMVGATAEPRHSTAQAATASEGGHVDFSMKAADDRNAAKLAAAYQKAGRSVMKDARKAGLSAEFRAKLAKQIESTKVTIKSSVSGRAVVQADLGPSDVYDSGCLADNVSEVQWEGCYWRYKVPDSDPDWAYRIDDGYASGHETVGTPFWVDLKKGRVGFIYQQATAKLDITRRSPGADILNVDECYSEGGGVSVLGFGISTSYTVCPERWDVTYSGLNSFPETYKVEWQGESHNDRESHALDAFRMQQGVASKMQFTIGADWG